ncbi:MAG: NAD-dependent epimerase/dehydratase family protein [Akkermansiaceae bacterium]
MRTKGRGGVILVTGASGLIGGALTRRLKSEGFEVWTPDRGSDGGLDLQNVSSAVFPEGLQTAFLCAWSGGVSEAAQDPEGMRRVNVEGNRELIERLRHRGTNVVFLSTSLVFSGADISASAPLSPCCVYGAQKAAVEAELDSRHDVIVRITKVGETLLPRLVGWAKMLRSGEQVAAASHLRVAPIMLEEAVEGLVGLARDFQPGVYQMSARQDHSYLDLAEILCAQAGGTVADDPDAGVGVFHPLPVSGRLEIEAPGRPEGWPRGRDHTQRLVQSALS